MSADQETLTNVTLIRGMSYANWKNVLKEDDMDAYADKTQERGNGEPAHKIPREQASRSSAGFADNRSEARVQRKLQALANNSQQVLQARAVQELANKQIRQQPLRAVVQRVPSLVKAAARKLTFDSLVWGSHADHYGTEAKYVEKGRKIVEGGKPTHTTFMVDKAAFTENLIEWNIKKKGWMDSNPVPGTDFIVSPAMDFVQHT